MNFRTKKIESQQVLECLLSCSQEFGISIDEEKVDLLQKFVQELLAANQVFNLTNINDPVEIAENLLLDSLAPGKYVPSSADVIDIGTGAGFPGIPLRIVFPKLTLTLIDSKRKKINFLKYIIWHLELKEIEAIQVRAEEMAKSRGGQFDVIISKAVSSLPQLIRLGRPLLKQGGMLIAMKGRGYQTELDRDKLAEVVDPDRIRIRLEQYRLPNLKIDRTLVIVEFD